MKKTVLNLCALTIMTLAFASVANAGKCIQSERDIQKVPTIDGFVNKLGGIASLEGIWKLGGFAGNFKKVVISFESASDGLKALVDGLDKQEPKWGPISVCDTVRADTLQVKILKTQDSLYMRLGSAGSLQLAQIANGKVGTFYSFIKD